MNKLTLTAGALLTALFPKSQKAISEGLSTEDFNAFSAELVEVGTRINSQTEGNEKMKTDFDAATKRADEADAKVKSLTDTQKDLQGKLQAAEADRDKYKEHYDEQANAGKISPKEDANSRKEGGTNPNDPNALALKAWKASH